MLLIRGKQSAGLMCLSLCCLLWTEHRNCHNHSYYYPPKHWAPVSITSIKSQPKQQSQWQLSDCHATRCRITPFARRFCTGTSAICQPISAAADGSYSTAVAIACFDDDPGPCAMGCPHPWSVLPGCTAEPLGAAAAATGAHGPAAQHRSSGCDAADTSPPHTTVCPLCCGTDLLAHLHWTCSRRWW